MKRVIITLALISFATSIFSQEALSKRAVCFEIGGSGIATSINYEQKVWIKSNNAFSLKGGLGYFPLITNGKLSAGTYSMILGGNFIRTHKNHGITLGISTAFTTSFGNRSSNDFKAVSYSHLVVPQLGYRYQNPQKHNLFAGIGYSPIISYDGLSVENNLLQFKNHFYLSVGLYL